MLHYLFEAQSTKSPSHRIREAWAFDWQTHGDSAVLNSNALKTRPDGVCEPAPYAQGKFAWLRII
jgi:hypothetical protein